MPNVKINGIDIEDLLKIAKKIAKRVYFKIRIGKKFDRKRK